MSIAWTITRRSLFGRPGRTLFCVLGVALGVATVVAVYTLDHNTVAGLRRKSDPGWRAELEVRAKEDLDNPLSKLAELEGVGRVAPFFQHYVTAHVGDKSNRAVVFGGDVEALFQMGGIRLVAGRLPDPEVSPPELLLGPGLAESLALTPGDSIDLARPARAVRRECQGGEMVVVGGGERAPPPRMTFRISGIMANEALGALGGGDVLVAPHARAVEVLGDLRIDQRYFVERDPEVDLERLRRGLAGHFAYDVKRSIVIGEAADERAFRNGVLFAGFLALVLGLHVVFHTLSTSLLERMGEIATLHALGTSHGRIVRAFLLESALLAVLGGALGLGLGVGLARAALRAGLTTLGSGRVIETFEVPYSVVLPLALLGTVVALSGAVWPLLRITRADTAAHLRGEEPTENEGNDRAFQLFAVLLLLGLLPGIYFTIVPVVGEASGALVATVLFAVFLVGLLLAVPLLLPGVLARICGLFVKPLVRRFPFSGRLAAVNFNHDRRRIAISTAAIALVATAFMALKGMTASLRAEIHDWAGDALVSRVYVEDLPLDTSFAELQRALSALPEVRGVESGSLRAHAPFLLLGLHADGLEGHGPLHDEPELLQAFRTGNGILLSTRVARGLGYAIGDLVKVSTGAGRVREFPVLALTDAYGYFPHPDERMYGIVDASVLGNDFCLATDKTDRIAIQLSAGASIEALKPVLQAVLPNVPIRMVTGRELERAHVEDVDRDFFIFDLILGLSALLAGLGVLNGQLLSALERTPELGVLKALGASPRQVAGLLWIEAAVVGAVGGVCGLLLGNTLAPLLVRVLSNLSGLELPYATAGSWLLLAPLGALALTFLAAVYPVWRINRIDAVRAVRTG